MAWYNTMIDIRTQAGDTQKQMAQKLGWSRPQIQRYEKGKYPTIEYLIAFCKLYKVNPDRILWDDLKGGE